jgi:hypothetical protein
VDNHSPNASRIQDWRVKIQTHSPIWRGIFPLSLSYYIFGQLFSDMASENTELLANLAIVLKNFSTPLIYTNIIARFRLYFRLKLGHSCNAYIKIVKKKKKNLRCIIPLKNSASIRGKTCTASSAFQRFQHLFCSRFTELSEKLFKIYTGNILRKQGGGVKIYTGNILRKQEGGVSSACVKNTCLYHFYFPAVPYFMFPVRDQHLDVGSGLTHR